MLTMASDIRLALDPALIGERVGLALDSWQAKLLREQPRRALLLCSRQSGKSTITALLALWTAIYDPGLILLLSPSQRQSQELFRLVMLYHAKLKDAPALVSESALRAETSGSRIVALPGSERTTRGYAAAKLVVIDEAARVDDSLLAAIRPTLGVSNGSLIALSTPAGKRGWFYEAWIGGDPSWHQVKVTAEQCPRLSKAFLDEEMRSLGPMMFRQEYCLEFIDDGECVFPVEMINRAFVSEIRSIW